MFPTRNGTGVLFITAYIDHGSPSGQSNGASCCYVVCYLLYGFLETLSALCGESANVDKEAADDWKRHLAVVVGYAIEDQFNADETAVFYRQLPRKSMVSKGNHAKVASSLNRD